jgi:prepilin-type N-terminal cleavage/methylation domain-containing protein
VYSNKDHLGRRGFTLVELMVSVVLGAILIGVVLNFVTGQTRVATAQSGREEVQQNARGALEMVASDLRGAISAGVVRGDANSVEFLLPRRWGVVCSQDGPASTTVVFPVIPGQPAPAGGLDAGLLLSRAPAIGWAPALPVRATVTQATLLVGTQACNGVLPSGNVAVYRLEGANHPAGILPGATAALYQRVRYSVQESRGAQWIHRSNGMTAANTFSMQPLAGPVDVAGGGISFTYFTGTPPVALANPPGTNAAAVGLSQVRLRVRMRSRQGGSAGQVEYDSATVQIRNTNNN